MQKYNLCLSVPDTVSLFFAHLHNTKKGLSINYVNICIFLLGGYKNQAMVQILSGGMWEGWVEKQKKNGNVIYGQPSKLWRTIKYMQTYNITLHSDT